MSYTVPMPSLAGETHHSPADPTVVLGSRSLERHPSFPDGMPAIVAPPVPRGTVNCYVCQWLDYMLDQGRDYDDHMRNLVGHVNAAHARAAR